MNIKSSAKDAKAWPFIEAQKLLKRYEKSLPANGSILFETGYGPSGLPHIGTFGEVVRTMRSDDVTYYLSVALDVFGDIMHPVGYMNISAFLQKAEKERSGVISNVNSGLEIWANPLIDTATASSDFSFLEMKRKKTFHL